jgi:DNA-binding transcriptional LysR family regulator
MDIEIYGLRIFYEVMIKKGFSSAGRSLKLTQPTVSQQIAKLEQQLNQKLFERVGHDIIPTHLAQDLFQFATRLLEMVDEYQEKVQENLIEPRGMVRYAMPESCQWTPHYRKIMSQISAFPELKFEIGILPNDQITKGLIEGYLDFGFVTGDRLNPELRFEKFAEEAYSAVAAKKSFFGPLEKGKPETLRLVTYPGWEPFFTVWAKTHGLWKILRERMSESTVHVGTLSGAIHAVQEGAGVSIIPTHCIGTELQAKTLYEWKPSNLVAANTVYFAKRVGGKLPKRVELVVTMLKQAKASFQ